MRKQLLSILLIVMLLLCLSACNGSPETKKDDPKTDKKNSYDYSDWQDGSYNGIQYKIHNWTYDSEAKGEGNRYNINVDATTGIGSYIYVSYSDFDSKKESESEYYGGMKDYFADFDNAKLVVDKQWSNDNFSGHEIRATYDQTTVGVTLNFEQRVVKFIYKDTMYAIMYTSIVGANEHSGFQDWEPFLNSLTPLEDVRVDDENNIAEPETATKPATETVPSSIPEVDIDKSEYKSISYSEISRLAEAYEAEHIVVKGEVQEISQVDSMTGIQIAMDGKSNQLVYVLFSPELWDFEYNSGQSVTVYGYLSGTDPDNGLPWISPDGLEN